MTKKSPSKRIERLELVCLGAGLLLKKLQYRYGSDFGYGMDEQVRQCLRDIRQIEASHIQRKERAEAEGSGP
jgi:hypothetical protein